MLGARSYSDAVNVALAEVIRMRKVQSLGRFFGSGIWEGDLAEMRGDGASERRRSE